MDLLKDFNCYYFRYYVIILIINTYLLTSCVLAGSIEREHTSKIIYLTWFEDLRFTDLQLAYAKCVSRVKYWTSNYCYCYCCIRCICWKPWHCAYGKEFLFLLCLQPTNSYLQSFEKATNVTIFILWFWENVELLLNMKMMSTSNGFVHTQLHTLWIEFLLTVVFFVLYF